MSTADGLFEAPEPVTEEECIAAARAVRDLIERDGRRLCAMAEVLAVELIYSGEFDWDLLDFMEAMDDLRKRYRKDVKASGGGRIPRRDYDWRKVAVG